MAKTYQHICAFCKKEFSSAQRNSKYCNNVCYSNSMKNRIELSCKVCGKKFSVKPCNKRSFCSPKCGAIGRKGNGTKQKQFNCSVCGKIVSKCQSYFKYKKAKYCSYKCRAKVVKGENNPAWKGGVTSTRQRLRHCFRYNEWRTAVFFRDNFTCQKCSKIGGKLEAHHIKKFSILIQEAKEALPLFDLYQACIVYTPMWKLDNGITLCKKCHRSK